MFNSNEKVDRQFLVDDLNDLVQLHYDMIASYQNVVEKAPSAVMKTQMEQFIVAHRAQIGALIEVIQENYGHAKSGSVIEELTLKLRLAAGQLFNESGMYAAMKANEEKVVLEYERAINSLVALPGMETVLIGNYEAARYRVMTIEHLLAHAKAERK